jgi:acetyl esterase/lipase
MRSHYQKLRRFHPNPIAHTMDSPPSRIPMSLLSADARRLMAEIGPVWGSNLGKHRDAVFSTYTPILERIPDDGIRATRDIAYGPHARHTVDVYQPEGKTGVPVVMFIHGGAFIRGAKDANPQLYSNVARYFAHKGLLGINVEYRLAPEAQYPEGARDIAAAVAWVRAHAREYGGDPEKIFLVGHSAGGTHATTYVADPKVRPASGPGIAGLVLLSARLRVDARPENPNANGVRAYFGDDAALYEERSPVTYAANVDVPTFLVVAEFDNPLLDIYGAEMLHRVAAARGRAPRFMRLTRHNHSSLAAHFNTGEEILGLEILDFIERGY